MAGKALSAPSAVAMLRCAESESMNSSTSRASTASTASERSASSIAPRTRLPPRCAESASERMHYHVDCEPRWINRQEALGSRMKVPLAAVILVAVQHGNPVSVHRCQQVLVYQVVAPAVQLVPGCRRAIRKLEKTVVQPMVVWKVSQRPYRTLYLFHRRLVEGSVNVVVVVIHEEKAPPFHEALQHAPLLIREAHREVPGEKHEWEVQQRRRA